MELVPVLTIPDNIYHFQVFEDDRHILVFLSNFNDFEDPIIDEDDRKKFASEEGVEGIIDLFTNFIPKGMVTP